MRTRNLELKHQTEESAGEVQSGRIASFPDRLLYVIYVLALAVSVSIWFIAIRAPLWLDETVSFWQISAGFAGIWSRQWNSFPAYSYILWLDTKIIGTSASALRIPSVLAMLVAVYLLYRAARELFDRDVAITAAVIFSVHPIVILESIDARPYAFAVLATNAAILALIRLRNNNSNWSAAFFGFLSAFILYFHYLFGVILPALVIGFLVIKKGDRTTLWRQAGIAFASFGLAFLPVIPGLDYLLHTAGTHVFALAPSAEDLVWTLAPGWLLLVLIGTALVAIRFNPATTDRRDAQNHFESWHVLVCASLALVPILILYGVSLGTSIHIFVPRYRLVAIPGVALCWALVVSRFNWRAVRLLFCLALVSTTAYKYFSSPAARRHDYTWKYALEVAEKNASADDAPVLMCSDFPESDYVAMPLHSAKQSNLFAPLSYYKLSVPVVPLPRALNKQAIRIVSSFLQVAAHRHERFLALAFKASYAALDWIANRASGAYNVRELGVFDGVKVLEFTPRNQIPKPQ